MHVVCVPMCIDIKYTNTFAIDVSISHNFIVQTPQIIYLHVVYHSAHDFSTSNYLVCLNSSQSFLGALILQDDEGTTKLVEC